MKIKEHPPATMGGRTTYTVTLESVQDAETLREMEEAGLLEDNPAAFKHDGKGEIIDGNNTRGK